MKNLIDKSKTPAIITIFIIVPSPGFWRNGIHIDNTIMLEIKVAKPIDQLNLIDKPSARTTHGALPMEAWKSKEDPNPKIISPKHRNKKVFSLGLKFKGVFEDQVTFGIFFIFKNI